ncbi:MAG: hypothetical protein COB93_10305 [Sneathiella sp.]|nr:MAG: hypothetical protein COB93_10305 [Sneathiella sp.]
MKQYDFQDLSVAAAYKSFSGELRGRLMALRQLILETAEKTEDVGAIEETLKWGVPAYLPIGPKSGTTIRLAPTKEDQQYGLFVHCQTSLIKDFKAMHPRAFTYSGSRALLFDLTEDAPDAELLAEFIENALTYHTRKSRPGSR